MNRLYSSSLLAACFFASCAAPTRSADVDMMESMQEYMALGTPGEEHQELAKQIGTWKTTMLNRMGPDEEWQTMTATATYEPMFDGRFVIGREKGEFDMEGQKMMHESMMIMGFDKLQGEWTTAYYSSMSTWNGELRGKKNDKGEIEYTGTHFDNLTPKGRPAKALSRWEGDDKMVFEMWDSIDGEMVHIMTWTAERM